MKRLVLLLIFIPLLLVSCEVEFSPNAEWKEVPVVYCLLDQDEDTTWVRVERCYLSEGDIRQYGTTSDSINYPQGALQVSLLAIKDDRVVDSVDLTYTTRDRKEGDFVSENQPMYYCYTKKATQHRLRDDCYYILRIRRTADNTLLAEAATSLITYYSSDNPVSQPNDNTPFGFSWTKNFKIIWRSFNQARLYQPIVRFYYSYRYLDGDTHYVDFPCATRLVPPYADKYTVTYSRDAFLSAVSNYFQGDTNSKRYLQIFDIYITMCDENLYAYMQAGASGSTVDQNHEVYTNIDGGLGVFGARRTKVCRRVPGDPSDQEGVGLNSLLKGLGVGFI